MTLPRVLLCHNHYSQPGGESAVFENLVRGLRQRGHPVISYRADNQVIDEMSAGRRLLLLGSAHWSRQSERELKALVAREKPDVAIVQNVFPLLSPSVYSTLHQLGVPVIQATYNYRLVCPAGELYSRGEICERCLHGNHVHCVVRRCYRDSIVLSAWYASIVGWHRWRGTFSHDIDIFQVPDQFMADKLVEGGLPRAKMVQNVNPFFVRDYAATTSHDGYVAYAGRLVRHKGILTLLEAVRLSEQARVVVVGTGELEPELREFVRRHALENRVQLAGPLWGVDLQRVLARACAVAVPSEWYDNLPLTLCQANALGKPVLASRINGIPEDVDDGVNGFLFAPGNAEELRRCLEATLSLGAAEYKSLAAKSRSVAEDRLDFQQDHRVLTSVFDRLGVARAGDSDQQP